MLPLVVSSPTLHPTRVFFDSFDSVVLLLARPPIHGPATSLVRLRAFTGNSQYSMCTPTSSRRRQPDRAAKTQAAREQMGQRKLTRGMVKATPNQHYLGIAQRNAQESTLLRLPPELRNRIWRYVVAVEEILLDEDDTIWDLETPQASVLRVCRQVHAETCLLLYSINLFGFHDAEQMAEWTTRRLPEQKDALKRIRIFCPDTNGFNEPFRTFSGLKILWVDCICDGTCAKDLVVQQAHKKDLHDIWGNSDLEIRFNAGCWPSGSTPPPRPRPLELAWL